MCPAGVKGGLVGVRGLAPKVGAVSFMGVSEGGSLDVVVGSVGTWGGG